MAVFSILDLSPIVKGGDRRPGALNNTRDLAQHAERWGYRRFWVAEHHNMAGHRQRRHRAGDPAYRRRHQHDTGGRGRHHAAQPCAADHRRAVRHAGRAVPGTDRSRPRPCARHRPAHRPRPAPQYGRSGESFRRTCWNCSRIRPASRAAVRAVPGGGTGRADLAAGLEPVQRPACRRTGPAICVRLPFRAGLHAVRHRNLPQPLQAVGQLASRMSWSGSTCLPPTTMPPRSGCLPRCSSSFSTWCAACRATPARRWTAWTALGAGREKSYRSFAGLFGSRLA